MANNLEIQKQKAIEMREDVKKFAAILTQKMDDLEGTLRQSVRAGFPEDVALTYHSRYYTPDRQIIEDLQKNLLESHVDYLDRIIADLTDAINQQ